MKRNIALPLIAHIAVILAIIIAFGAMSDDHFRFSIVQSEERLNEAFDRMEKAGIRFA